MLESLRGGPDISRGQTILVEVGGGSADVTMLSNGELLQSGTFPLSSTVCAPGWAPLRVPTRSECGC